MSMRTALLALARPGGARPAIIARSTRPRLGRPLSASRARRRPAAGPSRSTSPPNSGDLLDQARAEVGVLERGHEEDRVDLGRQLAVVVGQLQLGLEVAIGAQAADDEPRAPTAAAELDRQAVEAPRPRPGRDAPAPRSATTSRMTRRARRRPGAATCAGSEDRDDDPVEDVGRAARGRRGGRSVIGIERARVDRDRSSPRPPRSGPRR